MKQFQPLCMCTLHILHYSQQMTFSKSRPLVAVQHACHTSAVAMLLLTWKQRTALQSWLTMQNNACTQKMTTVKLLHIHTHLFNGPLSGTTWVGQYQQGKTKLDFTEARDSEWYWHQLGHMQVCTSLQTDNHASTPPLSCFTGRMPFLLPNQQCQSTEGVNC